MVDRPGTRIRRLERVVPGIFLFILPFTHTTPLRLSCLALLILQVVVSVAWDGKRRAAVSLPPRSVLLVFAFWFAVCLAASFASIDPTYSWGEFRNEVAYPLAAFAIFYWLTDSSAAWRTWRAVLLVSFCSVSILAIASFLQNREWLRTSFVGDRNAYSTYVVLMFPFLILMLSTSAARSRRAAAAIGAVMILALVSGGLTLNRNLWLALAAETVVFAALYLARSRDGTTRGVSGRHLLLGGLGVVVFSICFLLVTHQKSSAPGNDPKQAQFSLMQDPRFEIWSYAGEYIAQRPLTGYGYGRGILRKDFRAHFGDPLKWHGHNVVVNYTIEAGLAGAVAIIALLGAFYHRSWKVYRSGEGGNKGSPVNWQLGAWGLAVLAGITLKMMTDDILIRENSLLFWSMFGMTWGLASRRSESAEMPQHV